MQTEEEITRVSTVFSALSNSTRLKILFIISETKRPLHIKAVAKALKMDYAAVYRHVGVLKKTKLLEIFEVGRSRVLSPLHTDLVKQLVQLAKKVMLGSDTAKNILERLDNPPNLGALKGKITRKEIYEDTT